MRQQLGVFVALTSLALSNFAVFVINMYYFRPRPFVDLDINLLFYKPTDSSFPSNSVAAVFGIAFGVWGGEPQAGMDGDRGGESVRAGAGVFGRPLSAGRAGGGGDSGYRDVHRLPDAGFADAGAGGGRLGWRGR